MPRRISVLVAAAAVGAALLSPLAVTAPANAFILPPDDMRYVGQRVDGGLVGPFSALAGGEVFLGQTVTETNPARSTEVRAVAEFDLSTILPGAAVALVIEHRGVPSTTTSCFNFSGCPTLHSARVYNFEGNGVVEQADFHRLDFLSGGFSGLAVPAFAGYSLSVRVDQLLTGGASHLGIVLDPTSTGATTVLMHLDVVNPAPPPPPPPPAVPLPATLPLMAVAFGGMALLRRGIQRHSNL